MSTVISTDAIKRYWHHAAPAFDRKIDAGITGLGRSAAEIRAWELLFRRTIGAPPRRVLDVGTGAGSLSLLLASLGYQVTAVDAVERLLTMAAANAERSNLALQLHVALADELPFEAGAFDAVTSKLVLWTLLEPELAVTEWMRVTVPGGRIIAIDGWNVLPTNPLERARIRLNMARLSRRGGMPRAQRAQLPLGEFTSPEAYRNVFARAGLERVLVEELPGIRVLERQRRSWAASPLPGLPAAPHRRTRAPDLGLPSQRRDRRLENIGFHLAEWHCRAVRDQVSPNARARRSRPSTAVRARMVSFMIHSSMSVS